MDLTYADGKNLKTLEEYAMYLCLAKLSLTTLYNHQVTALELPSLTEDLRTRIGTILWDFRRAIKQIEEQLEEVLKLVPDDMTPEKILENMREREIKLARKLTRDNVKRKTNIEGTQDN